MAEPIMIRGRPPKSTVIAFLQSQGLPVSDITDGHLEHFFLIGSDGSPTGIDRAKAPDTIQSTREFANLRGEFGVHEQTTLVRQVPHEATSRACQR
jgi:hypothetical protein